MKYSIAYLLFAVFVIAAACSKESSDDSCLSPILVETYKDTSCPAFPKPVCACNNETFINACEANKQGFFVLDTVPCGQ